MGIWTKPVGDKAYGGREQSAWVTNTMRFVNSCVIKIQNSMRQSRIRLW